MAEVTYVRADGERRTLDVPEGTSLMTGAVGHQLDGIVGECGGQMMCATCHVYVEPRFLGQLAAPSDDEDAMLDTTACPRLPNSRLSCQLIASGALDGIVVHTPETQLLISTLRTEGTGPCGNHQGGRSGGAAASASPARNAGPS